MFISKPQFVRKNKNHNIVIALQKECVWDFVFAACHVFHPIMQLICLCDLKIPNMHLLKYYVMQADRMLKEYSPKVDMTYAVIPQNICDIIGDTSTYDVAFNISPSLPQVKPPWFKLKPKANDEMICLWKSL